MWQCTEPRSSDRTSEFSEHQAAGVADREGSVGGVRAGREDSRDVAAVAVEYGVGWHTIMRAVHEQARPLV